MIRLGALVVLVWWTPLRAQTGTLIGRVHHTGSHQVIAGAEIMVDDRHLGVTDELGEARLVGIAGGWHQVRVAVPGLAEGRADSVVIWAETSTTIDFALDSSVSTVVVTVDPLATNASQRFTSAEITAWHRTSVADALSLATGLVDRSVRGGRPGEQGVVLDGVPLRGSIDASTSDLGFRVPVHALSEIDLGSNAFSARFGDALSGVIGLVTRRPRAHWLGSAEYASDRALSGAGDLGFDRAALDVEGPINRWLSVLGAVDVTGMLDAAPANAPVPADPRAAGGAVLPHNSGERIDAIFKMSLMSAQRSAELLAASSREQRLIFDPAFRYEPELGAARRVDARLLSGTIRQRSSAGTVAALLQISRFSRDLFEGAIATPVGYSFGAFAGDRLRFLGEQVAREVDTAGADAAIPGFQAPELSERTPWGVPAFFLGSGPRGTINFNRLEEVRGRAEVDAAPSPTTRFVGGVEFARQRIRLFERVAAYAGAGGSVPAPSGLLTSPSTAAAYGEGMTRIRNLGFTFGLRVNRVSWDDPSGGGRVTQTTMDPRLAFTAITGSTSFIASVGRFSQAPDYQYLVDALFADPALVGARRGGNGRLRLERAWHGEVGIRGRPNANTEIRAKFFVKQLDGLLAVLTPGANPDSSTIENVGRANAHGAELLLQHERDGTGWRVAYTWQFAEGSPTDPRAAPVSSNPIGPLDFDQRHSFAGLMWKRWPLARAGAPMLQRATAGLQSSVALTVASGLPFTLTSFVTGAPRGSLNDARASMRLAIDLFLRRPLRFAGRTAAVYFDCRNLLNRRNVNAIGRGLGMPGASTAEVDSLATAAYNAHPESIPYQSPRYRASADQDGNGLIEGAELMPLYQAAAGDYTRPILIFGPPRQVRLGVELSF